MVWFCFALFDFYHIILIASEDPFNHILRGFPSACPQSRSMLLTNFGICIMIQNQCASFLNAIRHIICASIGSIGMNFTHSIWRCFRTLFDHDSFSRNINVWITSFIRLRLRYSMVLNSKLVIRNGICISNIFCLFASIFGSQRLTNMFMFHHYVCFINKI